MLFHNIYQQNSVLLSYEMIELVHKTAHLQVLQWWCIYKFHWMFMVASTSTSWSYDIMFDKLPPTKLCTCWKFIWNCENLSLSVCWLFMWQFWEKNEHHYCGREMSCDLLECSRPQNRGSAVNTLTYIPENMSCSLYLHISSYTWY